MTLRNEQKGNVQLAYDAGEPAALVLPQREWRKAARTWYHVAECLLGGDVTARERATWEHTIIERKR